MVLHPKHVHHSLHQGLDNIVGERLESILDGLEKVSETLEATEADKLWLGLHIVCGKADQDEEREDEVSDSTRGSQHGCAALDRLVIWITHSDMLGSLGRVSRKVDIRPGDPAPGTQDLGNQWDSDLE